MRRLVRAAPQLAIVLLVLAIPSHAWSEAFLDFYLGKSFTQDSDLHIASKTRSLQGTLDGSPAGGDMPVDSVVQRFEISHGVNYVTLDALFRYPLFAIPEPFPRGRFHLYAGVGVGPVIAHPESRMNEAHSEPGDEVAGVGVQGFAGVRFLIFKYLGVFAEYKSTHSDLSVSVPSGTGRVHENTNHLIGDLTMHFT